MKFVTALALFFALAFTCLAQLPTFEVRVEGRAPLTLSAEDISKMPSHTIGVNEHGKDISYTGVLVYDVLVKTGVPMGAQLRGKVLSSYMLATAKDGYAVLYALPEFDPAFTNAQPLIATAADSKPLDANQGPFRIVMPQDKKPARSLRMLQMIEIVQLRK
jgi:hypothetical protein